MKKIYIIGIVLALVFSITGCGIRETKNADKLERTVSTETKRQEPLRIEKTQKGGKTYIQEQYLQYQIKYLAMDKKVISEEKVKEFINTNGIKKKFFANLLGISVAKLSAMLQGK